MPKNQDVYLAELEQDKADLLEKVANYEKEQQASVKVFKDQAKLISQKEQQLANQDQFLTEKEERITKLKAQIKVLSPKKKSNPYATTIASDNETSDSEEIITSPKNDISTQTEGKNSTELEEEILEKRVENLKDFSHYQSQLKAQAKQLTLYQTQIKKLQSQNNPHQEQLTLLISLAVIITLLLIFK